MQAPVVQSIDFGSIKSSGGNVLEIPGIELVAVGSEARSLTTANDAPLWKENLIGAL